MSIDLLAHTVGFDIILINPYFQKCVVRMDRLKILESKKEILDFSKRHGLQLSHGSIPNDLKCYVYDLFNSYYDLDDDEPLCVNKLVVLSRTDSVDYEKCYSRSNNPNFKLKKNEYIARVVRAVNHWSPEGMLYDTSRNRDVYDFKRVCILGRYSTAADLSRLNSVQKRTSNTRKAFKIVPRLKIYNGSLK